MTSKNHWTSRCWYVVEGSVDGSEVTDSRNRSLLLLLLLSALGSRVPLDTSRSQLAVDVICFMFLAFSAPRFSGEDCCISPFGFEWPSLEIRGDEQQMYNNLADSGVD